MKQLTVYIVGKPASGKTLLREFILERYKPLEPTELHIHTVQQAAEDQIDEAKISWNDNE